MKHYIIAIFTIFCILSQAHAQEWQSNSKAGTKTHLGPLEKIRVTTAIAGFATSSGIGGDGVTVLSLVKSSQFGVREKSRFCCGQGCKGCLKKRDSAFFQMIRRFVEDQLNENGKLPKDKNFALVLKQFNEIHANDIVVTDLKPAAQQALLNQGLTNLLVMIVAQTPSRESTNELFRSALKVLSLAFSEGDKLLASPEDQYQLSEFKKYKSRINWSWNKEYLSLMAGSYKEYSEIEKDFMARDFIDSHELIGSFIDFLLKRDQKTPSIFEALKPKATEVKLCRKSLS